MNEASKKKILVVDDDDIILNMVYHLLIGDYSIITAKSAKDAIKRISQGLIPDLIMLDIIMPDIDGWETYNRLRAISFLSDAPIVFLTSLHEKKDRMHAYEIGAADYIHKPFDNDDLSERLRVILEKNKS